ncbi:phosphoribosylaminoimidazolesuccinocarboxamide synthase [Paenibacillus sp. chi10]|uniref:Phosphoribosylaminoimidazole-succinocarboxamide synthase n=1 Tax=Paenibacillus suaedae TaxID=3077233 RepID=A0AAJ2N6K3_9BACL|nr:phosphoribosylaminoimidazolesuccinocarboxamide synthase [Paenibacillus sp. chi10]MDT8979156.1 phosphoribosylaminoimidazolesuccinocarboxamide synthase [Paenibacillus sp. chi10]
MSTNTQFATETDIVPLPLLHRGKVRELYELDPDHLLIVVSDRISAFDAVLKPEVPGKGEVLNRLSQFWFEQTKHVIANHVVPFDEGLLKQTQEKRLEQYRSSIHSADDMHCCHDSHQDSENSHQDQHQNTHPESHPEIQRHDTALHQAERNTESLNRRDEHLEPQDLSAILSSLQDRMTIARRAKRIDFECVVRGYITGGGWRQYTANQSVNGIELPAGLRMNEKLPEPIFTPSRKHDEGHDEDVPFAVMCKDLGAELAKQLRQVSIELYTYAAEICASKGILLADCKFEFGTIDGELVLIDELFTPDSSRFWSIDQYVLDQDIDSLDKEPVRRYLAASGWDKCGTPPVLPEQVVEATRRRYIELYERITEQAWPE